MPPPFFLSPPLLPAPLTRPRRNTCRTPPYASLRQSVAHNLSLAAAAALTAAVAVKPRMLPPTVRKAAPPLIIILLLISIAIGPSEDKDVGDDDDDDVEENERQTHLAAALDAAAEQPLKARGTGNKAEVGGPRNAGGAFSASRRDWDDPMAVEPPATNAPPSSVYSHAYRRSKKAAPASVSTPSTPAASHFSHMRSDFEAPPAHAARTEPEEFWMDDEPRDGGPDPLAVELQPPAPPPPPLTARALVSKVLHAPAWVVSAVVLPLVDVVTLSWHDVKTLALDWPHRQQRRGADRYLLPPIQRPVKRRKRRDGSRRADGEGLSEEERQVEEVQRVVGGVVKEAGRAVRRVLGGWL